MADTGPPDNAGGESAGPPDGMAPDLPDAVPDGVQKLLDGIFGGIDAAGKAFGKAVAGLAEAIAGGGSSSSFIDPTAAIDVVVSLL